MTTKTLNEVTKTFHPMVGATGRFNGTYQHRAYQNGTSIKLIGPGITSRTYRAIDQDGRRSFVNAADFQPDEN